MRTSACLLSATTLLAAASPVFAALGGGTDTIVKDHKALKATRRVSAPMGNYSVEEMTTPAATC